MKELILNYIKMFKAGFFNKSLLYALLLIIPSVLRILFNVGSDLYEIFFVIIVGFFIVSSGMNEISEKRYIFCSTLPMRTIDIIKIAYVNNYLIYIVGFIGTFLVSICSHQKLPTRDLLLIVLFLLRTNFLYPYLASSELKVKADPQADTVIWQDLLFLNTVAINIFPFYGIINPIGYNTVFYCELLGIVIISFIAAFTLKISYKATIKKVMGA